MLIFSSFSLKKILQMEGDIRSSSSDEISDTPVNNIPINNTNYIN